MNLNIMERLNDQIDIGEEIIYKFTKSCTIKINVRVHAKV